MTTVLVRTAALALAAGTVLLIVLGLFVLVPAQGGPVRGAQPGAPAGEAVFLAAYLLVELALGWASILVGRLARRRTERVMLAGLVYGVFLLALGTAWLLTLHAYVATPGPEALALGFVLVASYYAGFILAFISLEYWATRLVIALVLLGMRLLDRIAPYRTADLGRPEELEESGRRWDDNPWLVLGGYLLADVAAVVALRIL